MRSHLWRSHNLPLPSAPRHAQFQRGHFAEALCHNCNDELWVCESHTLTAWKSGQGCCGEPGVPCHCNPTAAMPPGFRSYCCVSDPCAQ